MHYVTVSRMRLNSLCFINYRTEE